MRKARCLRCSTKSERTLSGSETPSSHFRPCGPQNPLESPRMDVFVICPLCQRHVRETESRCAFCAAPFATARVPRSSIVLAVAAVASLVACYGHPPRERLSRPEPTDPPTTQPTSIGQATMEADGTLVLTLRAQSPGAIGDGQLRYAPTHAQYQSILRHVGAIRPGESRPVAPFP